MFPKSAEEDRVAPLFGAGGALRDSLSSGGAVCCIVTRDKKNNVLLPAGALLYRSSESPSRDAR